MRKSYVVFLDDVYLKSFSNTLEADILATGLRIFLAKHHMDIDIVHIKEEVIS